MQSVARRLVSIRGLAVALALLAGGLMALRPGPGRISLSAAAEPTEDVDIDGDGVPDELDRCPTHAGLSPDGCPPRDSDGDGLIDRVDGCADRPGPRDNGGCPDTDGDRDGVVDRRDKCRDVPGLTRFDGCRPPDADGDGITDDDDRCPDDAEVWNGRKDDDGCRDRGKALLVVATPRTAVVEGAVFAASGSLDRSGKKALGVAAAYAAALGAYRARVVLERKVNKARKQTEKELRRAQRRLRVVIDALRAHRARLEVLVEERTGDRDRVTVTLE